MPAAPGLGLPGATGPAPTDDLAYQQPLLNLSINEAPGGSGLRHALPDHGSAHRRPGRRGGSGLGHATGARHTGGGSPGVAGQAGLQVTRQGSQYVVSKAPSAPGAPQVRRQEGARASSPSLSSHASGVISTPPWGTPGRRPGCLRATRELPRPSQHTSSFGAGLESSMASTTSSDRCCLRLASGEPVELELSATNTRAEAVVLALGQPETEHLIFDVLDPDQRVLEGVKLSDHGGFYPIGKLRLAPGQSHVERIYP